MSVQCSTPIRQSKIQQSSAFLTRRRTLKGLKLFFFFYQKVFPIKKSKEFGLSNRFRHVWFAVSFFQSHDGARSGVLHLVFLFHFDLKELDVGTCSSERENSCLQPTCSCSAGFHHFSSNSNERRRISGPTRSNSCRKSERQASLRIVFVQFVESVLFRFVDSRIHRHCHLCISLCLVAGRCGLQQSEKEGSF